MKPEALLVFNFGKISLPKIGKSGFGGRCWDRTSGLFDVNEARYHCAKRPFRSIILYHFYFKIKVALPLKKGH